MAQKSQSAWMSFSSWSVGFCMWIKAWVVALKLQRKKKKTRTYEKGGTVSYISVLPLTFVPSHTLSAFAFLSNTLTHTCIYTYNHTYTLSHTLSHTRTYTQYTRYIHTTYSTLPLPLPVNSHRPRHLIRPEVMVWASKAAHVAPVQTKAGGDAPLVLVEIVDNWRPLVAKDKREL